jgi:hypothetical protein
MLDTNTSILFREGRRREECCHQSIIVLFRTKSKITNTDTVMRTIERPQTSYRV